MDRSFHNIGLPQNPRFGLDLGRARGATEVFQSPFNCQSAYSDTQDCPELKYLDPSFPDWPSAFKTPSLRNVAQTAPYMHDGSMADLQAVLSFYAIMPGQPIVGHREITLEALHLSNEQMAAITAFLGTLTSE
jgi:cytochrome c peroxidase